MDDNLFRSVCAKVVDFIISYNNTYDTRVSTCDNIIEEVSPGDIYKNLHRVTELGSDFPLVFDEFKKIIVPNTLNWQHPYFFGYFPSGNSYASIIGDLLSSGLGIIGFSWVSSPSCTELESFCMSEMIRVMCLPFKTGVILSSSSDSILVAVLCARNRYKREECSKLVVYTSELSHTCVEKACMISNVKLKKIKCKSYKVDTIELESEIISDLDSHLIPCMIVGTFGTTSVLSFDNLEELGRLSKKYNLFFHVDGAYSGGSLLIKKYRKLCRGLNLSDSFNLNANKLLNINFDCTLYFFNDNKLLFTTLSVDSSYLTSDFQTNDLRNYDIVLSRRFRSLKLWLTLRLYGLKKMRIYIKKLFKLAKIGHKMLLESNVFEIINEVKMGLVCIAMSTNEDTLLLYRILNDSRKMYVTSSVVYNRYIIRISVNNIHSIKSFKDCILKIIDYGIDIKLNRYNDIHSIKRVSVVEKPEDFKKRYNLSQFKKVDKPNKTV